MSPVFLIFYSEALKKNYVGRCHQDDFADDAQIQKSKEATLACCKETNLPCRMEHGMTKKGGVDVKFDGHVCVNFKKDQVKKEYSEIDKQRKEEVSGPMNACCKKHNFEGKTMLVFPNKTEEICK